MPYQTRFDLDLPEAIRSQLVAVFEALDPAPLRDVPPAGELEVTDEPGVYGLFLNDDLVYIGKTTNLVVRLGAHRKKISGRQNLTLDAVGFVAVAIHKNWRAYAPEGILIDHYKAQGLVEWNGSGFGPNDPGRKREQTSKPPEGFDATYPIRLDWTCDTIESGHHGLLDLLLALKADLPYVFRFQHEHHYKSGHPDYEGNHVFLSAAGMTPVEILKRVVRELPGWQATAFPSHIILYKEERTYAHGQVLAANRASSE